MTPGRVAAIILASGFGCRFGKDDKLLADLKGTSVAGHVAETVCAAGFAHTLAVTQANAPARASLFRAAGCTILQNDAPEAGQGASLALGIREAERLDVDAALVVLADMPFVTQDLFLSLCQEIGEAEVAICTGEGRRTPPVLFRRSLFSQLTDLRGDEGARKLLKSLSGVQELPVAPGLLRDIDQPGDLDP